MHKLRIAASILSANFAKLGEEANAVLAAGADLIHFDVMDNHYVPNLTVGPMVCKALREYGIKAPIDVHLMVKPVDALIVEFAKAGASIITIHPEATEHLDRSLQLIREHGCQAGLAFNPGTPLDHAQYVLDKLNLILIMSVNPGFGGQKFIPNSLHKIKQAQQWLERNHSNVHIQVDGGIKTDNISEIADAGADTFVIGSGLFHTPNYAHTMAELRAKLAKFYH